MPSSSLPQPSLDSEYVLTKCIFRIYVENVLKKFQTRFLNVLMCILRPDPLNDPDIQRFYKQLMLPKKSSVSGTSKVDRHKTRVYLQTRAGTKPIIFSLKCSAPPSLVNVVSSTRSIVAWLLTKETSKIMLTHYFIVSNEWWRRARIHCLNLSTNACMHLRWR